MVIRCSRTYSAEQPVNIMRPGCPHAYTAEQSPAETRFCRSFAYGPVLHGLAEWTRRLAE